jgi:Ca2+-binding EF-hand superfamily protein
LEIFLKEPVMTRALTLLTAAATAICFGSMAYAADEPDSDRSPKQRHEALFNELDSNHDGSITSDEVPEESRRLFERLKRQNDKDGDGKLSKDEFVAGLSEDQPDRSDRPRRGPDAPRGDDNRPDRQRPDARRPDGDRPDARRDSDRPDARRPDGDRPDGRRPDGERRRPEGRPEGGPEGMPGMMMGPALMRALDKDGDGKLSSSEISDAASALKKLDKNSDGEISRDEIVPPQLAGAPGGFRGRPGQPGRPGEPGRPNEPSRPEGGDQRPNPEALLARLKQLDKDGDGKFKKDELPERMQERFEQMDANGDGVIDETEMKEILPRLLRRFGEGGRPGNPEGGDRPRRERREGRGAEERKAPEKD